MWGRFPLRPTVPLADIVRPRRLAYRLHGMHRPVRFRSWHNYCVCLNRGTAHDCGRAPQRIYYFESLKLFAMYWLWYILIGLAAGYVASLIVKGSGSGMLLNLGHRYGRRGIGRMAFQTDGHRQHEHAGQPAHLRFRSDSPAVDSRAFRLAGNGSEPFAFVQSVPRVRRRNFCIT